MLLKYYWKNGLIVFCPLSMGHCVVCPSIYGFWLHLWYFLAIALSGPSIYGFWLHLWYLLAIALSFLRFTSSDYTFGIFWPLHCLSFDLRLLITLLVSFGHCIVCPSIYGFWLHLWYLLAIALSVLRFTASDYTFGIFWPLHCLSFDLRLLITPLVPFGHCVFFPSIYGFWLHLWYLLPIALSVRFTASDYTFGIFWPLHCLSFDLRLLITPLVSFGHCVVFPSIYGFWLHLWYLHTFLTLTSNHKSDIIVLLVTLTSNHKSDIIVLLVTLTSNHKSDIIVLLVTLTSNHKSDIIVLLVTLTSNHKSDIIVLLVTLTSNHKSDIIVLLVTLTSNHKSDIIVLLVTLTSNHKSDIIVLLVTLTSNHKSDIIVLLVTLTSNHKSDIIVLLVTLTSNHRPDITVFNNRFVISVRAWPTPPLNKSNSQEMTKWLRQVTVDTTN